MHKQIPHIYIFVVFNVTGSETLKEREQTKKLFCGLISM